MIQPRHPPPGSYVDDPAAKLDRADCAASEQTLAYALTLEAFHRVFDWIMRGEVSQRSLRFHLVVLCVCPQLLPCKYPSASWCARIHGVSRQWACRLQQEFVCELGDKIRFRGQRFRCRANLPQSRRGRMRRGTRGPQPGPVAGA
jgi:hypothetical protein